MTDIAGLVFGVAALWQSCVQAYEIIDSTRHHGMEFELLNVKFEVERVRLLCWGDALGLAGVQTWAWNPGTSPNSGDQSNINTTRLDVRLRQEDVRSTVLRLLGCIQHVFENTDRLQDYYGLQEAAPLGLTSQGQSQTQSHGQEQEPLPPQTQRILIGVFKRPYENLRRMAGHRQRSTALNRRVVWAVRDRRKFDMLISELRGFNDSLESLFPDAQIRAAAAMRAEIEGAVEIRGLRLLQEATAEEHQDLSECASLRLELLSVSRIQDDVTSQATTENTWAKDGWEDADEEIPRGNQQAEAEGRTTPTEATQEEPELDEMTKRLRELDLYNAKKSFGAVTLSLIGPHGGLAHVSGHVYWIGDKTDRTFPSPWQDRDKGFVSTTHAAFEIYKRKKYMKKPSRDKYWSHDSEDYALLDPESHVKFENENPGTVTVEGYGLECWDFETTKPRNREQLITVNYSDLPVLPARTLLRRIDDLQNHAGKFGWSPDKEELDLKEVVGTLGIVYYDAKYAKDPSRWIGDLYSLLNRTDVFADFTTSSTIGEQWAGTTDDGCIGTWNLLRQIIVGRELALRLKHLDEGTSWSGFTERVLASLIVSDLWLKHVQIVLTDAKLPADSPEGPETAEQKAQAEDYKNQGNEALKKNEYQKAVDLYTEAIKIDLSNAIYRCNRSAALIGLDMFLEAEEDAYVATLLDPKYAKAWSRLGMAIFKQGDAKRAKKAYERALQVAGKDTTAQMRQGLASAEEMIKEKIKAINSEKDIAKQHKLRSAFLDEDWEIFGKAPEFHSLVHEQQVEGLLLFAERMRWPYINEVRDYAEDVYSSLHTGGTVGIHLHDWLYGLVLPGKWFAFKIMTALILCTPSIRDKTGIAPYFDCGLVLPTRSYWRLRTVLGRVLGCLPGIISLCGWIGPCPKVEFDPPVERPVQPHHVRVKARRIALTEHSTNQDDGVWGRSLYDRRRATDIRPDEEMEPYMAEMRNPSNWLKKLAPQVGAARKAAEGKIQDSQAEHEAEYRASITFKMDNNEEAVTYKLFTNPVFVTPPPCNEGPRGAHEVHMRGAAAVPEEHLVAGQAQGPHRRGYGRR
ncbi:hypothetical protein TrVGV298_001029 [Trichoderma virens]|nr:hypothetical protein TrVGV298_001029 [Trichoderma virens]